MNTPEFNKQISDARKIAEKLNTLLREDALHRLNLYQDYAPDLDAHRWTPDFFQRCQLAEALCRKLDSIDH
jgi:hypothetical protein